MDDGPPAERLRRAEPFYVRRPLGYEGLLSRILEEPGESLRCIAAYHVGELGLVSLRPQLLRFRPEETGFFLARVVERTLELLSQPPQSRLLHV